MSILPAVSSLLGSKSCIRPSEASPYEENLSFFSLCILPPNAGKSQAFKHGCRIPIKHVEKANETCILLDKFTDTGLRHHLQSYKYLQRSKWERLAGYLMATMASRLLHYSILLSYAHLI